jgi:hypothetical protein
VSDLREERDPTAAERQNVELADLAARSARWFCDKECGVVLMRTKRALLVGRQGYT